MAATLTLSKIEIGFQYTTNPNDGIINNGTAAYAGTNLQYYDSISAMYPTNGPGYGNNDVVMGGTSFNIVKGGSTISYSMQDIKPFIEKRIPVSNTSDETMVKSYNPVVVRGLSSICSRLFISSVKFLICSDVI